MLRSPLCAVVALAIPCGVIGRQVDTGFLDRSLDDRGTVRDYQVFVPRSYDPSERWPIVLFLHGGGQEGSDGYRQTGPGLGEAIRRNSERFPAIVVFPQVRENHQWTGAEAEYALRALDAAQREFSTDPDRVYLTGLSRGGRGAYYIAYRHASRFAAILVACAKASAAAPRSVDGPIWLENSQVVPEGDGDPFAALADRLRGTPLWMFHGDEDTVVPVEESRSLFTELEKRNAPVRYSELPGVGHNSWDAAFYAAEPIAWLFGLDRRTH